jgi:GNAT superfamily N-acetyltransferase
MQGIRIERAVESQTPLILYFIRQLAEYEKLLHNVTADELRIKESLFGPKPEAEVVVAYLDEEPAGFAIFFPTYSTFLGRAGIYLEDLFVEPKFRGHGLGKALLVHLAKLTRERGGGRLEWSVLNWNEPSIQFYRGLGAEPLDEWTKYRVTGENLEKLAQTPIIRLND